MLWRTELTFLREGKVNLVASLQTFNELGVLEGKAHRHGRPLQSSNGFMLNRDLAVGCINSLDNADSLNSRALCGHMHGMVPAIM